ncbi:MAG TPA: alpha/beta hydrolase [Ktedonosporobacter sp.]|nr:alpha/beta hydrolase [Ktedonosporobacter sp.]
MECTLQNITVHYEVYGTGKPILMIHGFSPDYRLMTGCMEPLFSQLAGWQRIYIDLPGMGKTKGEDWIKSTDDMLEVVLEFIDAVIPDQHFLLAGESYGGLLARGIVSKRADVVDGMCLICPGIIADRTKRTLPEFVVIAKDEALLATLTPHEAEEFASLAVVQNQHIWERTRDEVFSGVIIADETFLEKIAQRYSFSFDVDALPEPFKQSVLFLTGRQDQIVGYRDAWDILENYPRATFAVLDRAGHNLQIEQSQLFEALVKEWLDRVKETIEA